MAKRAPNLYPGHAAPHECAPPQLQRGLRMKKTTATERAAIPAESQPRLMAKSRIERIERRLNTLATLALHVFAVLSIVFVRPRWSDVSIGVAFYLGGMFVITAGYHRYFAHRSYKTSRAFQAVLAALG